MARKKRVNSSDEDDVFVVHDSSSEEDEHVVEVSSDEEEAKSKKRAPAKKKAKHVFSSDEEEEEKPRKKKTTTRTRKGNDIEFEGEGEMPRTKKAMAAAKREKKAEVDFRIAGNEQEPVRIIPSDDVVAEKYLNLSIAQLKDWLRANDMMVSGLKHELVERCIDGHVNGRMSKCPRCIQGNLRFDADKGGVYTCTGYFDDDAKMRINCTFAEPEVHRLPWLNPEENTEEKKEERKLESAKAAVAAVDIPEDVLQKISQAGPKEVAEIVSEFCKNVLKLSLPADEKQARIKVGALLMSNRQHNEDTGKMEFDVKKVVALLEHDFPPATAKTAGIGEAGGGNSKVAANEPIAALLDECAVYEKKKGGENVGFKIRGLKTAAMSVRGLDFEITEGEPLGKPGNKKKVPGIGKSTAGIIQDFLDHNKESCAHLDKLKKDCGEA